MGAKFWSKACLIAVAALTATVLIGASGEIFRLESDRLNGTHRDLPVDIAPVEQGVMTIELTSPHNTLDIHGHRVELRPSTGGAHQAKVHVEFSGQADLVADISVAGVPGKLEDKVTLPRQAKEIAARIELARDGQDFLITALDSPSHIEIAVESRLASQMVSLCESLLPWGVLGCKGLETAFSTLRLPVPPPGTIYRVKGEDLSPGERKQLDAYLNLQ